MPSRSRYILISHPSHCLPGGRPTTAGQGQVRFKMKSDYTVDNNGLETAAEDSQCALRAVTWHTTEGHPAEVSITMETTEDVQPQVECPEELKNILKTNSQEIDLGDEEMEVAKLAEFITTNVMNSSSDNHGLSQQYAFLEEQLYNAFKCVTCEENRASSTKGEQSEMNGKNHIKEVDSALHGEEDVKSKLRTSIEGDVVLLSGPLDILEKPILMSIKAAGGLRLGDTSYPAIQKLMVLLAPSDCPLDYDAMTIFISKGIENTTNISNGGSDNSCLQKLREFIDHIEEEKSANSGKCLQPVHLSIDPTESPLPQKDCPDATEEAFDPLKRTGRPFGGLFNDMRHRYPQYLSDITDAFNLKSLAAVVFIYFVCITQVITFGGLMVDKTDGWMGVSELLMVTSVSGVLFALFSAQPLLIVGTTGPTVLFEEALYMFCQATGLEFMSFRLWVCVWVAIVAVIVVMVEGSFLVRYFSRFVMEIFTLMISAIFIYEVFNKIYKIFRAHPLQEYYPQIGHESELFPNSTLMFNATENSTSTFNSTGNVTGLGQGVFYTRWFDGDATSMLSSLGEPKSQPNTALLSLILTISTFVIAYTLKEFRNTHYFTRKIRITISDFAVPLAVVINVLIDFFIKDTYTQKLDIPSGLKPTSVEKRSWYIHPFGVDVALPIWAYFAAAVPGLLAFILIFIQTQISGVIAAKKCKKGTGFHLDLALVGSFGVLSGFLGMPLLTITTVRSLAHISALSVFSRPKTPEETTPKLKDLKEQRVTGFIVHVLVGLSVFLTPVLQKVPLAVLFGVFLYMGIAILRGSQLFDRIKLLFVPKKHHPKVDFVTLVTTKKMHVYTLIQVGCLVLLWAVRFTPAALAVPFLIAALIPVRKFLLPFVFSSSELKVLD